MRLPLVAIFFMTYFYRARRAMAPLALLDPVLRWAQIWSPQIILDYNRPHSTFKIRGNLEFLTTSPPLGQACALQIVSYTLHMWRLIIEVFPKKEAVLFLFGHCAFPERNRSLVHKTIVYCRPYELSCTLVDSRLWYWSARIRLCSTDQRFNIGPMGDSVQTWRFPI